MTEIKYQLLNENGLVGIAPKRGTEKSSGIDVFIPYGFNKEFYPKSDILIPLNIKLEIPDGFDAEVKNKSGVSTKLKLVKGAQLIDQDYRGNVKIHLFNMGDESVFLKPEMKIAQLVVRPVFICDWVSVQYIDDNTERKDGGFGSTGDKL